LVTNDFHFLRGALLAGAGIGALPWFMANADVEAKRLLRILPRHTTAGATLYLLVAPGQPLPRKTEVLRDYLIEHAPRALRRR
jgi:DNA-binding transcriptional LysR family regulator